MLADSKTVFWYVLFATNGKAAKINDYLKTVGIESFFPICYRDKRIRNTQLFSCKLQPLIRNFLFVKSSRCCLEPHLQEIKLRFAISSDLYYRYLGSKEIIVVPEKQMQSFIAVVRRSQERTIYLSNDEINLEKGTKIRIIGGALEGVEGIFIKIKGSNRVVVSLPNLFSVATAFIPTRFILPL